MEALRLWHDSASEEACEVPSIDSAVKAAQDPAPTSDKWNEAQDRRDSQPVLGRLEAGQETDRLPFLGWVGSCTCDGGCSVSFREVS